MKQEVQIFENKGVRTLWNETQEEWYFSIVDVIAVLTDSVDAAAYWRKLKQRLKEEGNETVTNCHGLKMLATDGKMRMTDVANLQQLFRIIQSVPSPKAEPFKLWMAEVAKERIDQVENPELSIEQAIQDYRRLGYSESWINQRIKSIEVRKALTDEWDKAGVKQGQEYALLTDLMTKTWSGMTTKQYKKHKNLKKENLRDNMTNLELIINMLSEATATELSANNTPKNLEESALIAQKGANVAKMHV